MKLSDLTDAYIVKFPVLKNPSPVFIDRAGTTLFFFKDGGGTRFEEPDGGDPPKMFKKM